MIKSFIRKNEVVASIYKNLNDSLDGGIKRTYSYLFVGKFAFPDEFLKDVFPESTAKDITSLKEAITDENLKLNLKILRLKDNIKKSQKHQKIAPGFKYFELNAATIVFMRTDEIDSANELIQLTSNVNFDKIIGVYDLHLFYTMNYSNEWRRFVD